MIRPAGLLSKVISKKHRGLAIAALRNRRNEKIILARIASVKGRAEESTYNTCDKNELPATMGRPPLSEQYTFSLVQKTIAVNFGK